MTILISSLTDEELIRFVDNKAGATDLEIELATRLGTAIDTIDEADVTLDEIEEALAKTARALKKEGDA